MSKRRLIIETPRFLLKNKLPEFIEAILTFTLLEKFLVIRL